MAKLKPAKNLRPKRLRVCATCKLMRTENGMVICLRENGINEDVGDMLHWQMVCDLWVDGDGRQNLGGNQTHYNEK